MSISMILCLESVFLSNKLPSAESVACNKGPSLLQHFHVYAYLVNFSEELSLLSSEDSRYPLFYKVIHRLCVNSSDLIL